MTAFRTAFVTGASSGLGAAIARRLARSGCRVVLAARRLRELEGQAEVIRAAGGRAEVQGLDVRDRDAVATTVARWDAEVGGLDLVLAGAGIGAARHATRLTRGDVEAVLEVNALGAVATVQAGLECMLPRGRGTLGAISSIAAYRGLPGSGSYAASKACVSTYLETLNADLATSGIRLVDLRPGFVRTPMTADARFPMPFLMDVEPAAARCLRALERGRRLAAFPAPMRLAAGAARLLPEPLWHLCARALGRRAVSAEDRTGS